MGRRNQQRILEKLTEISPQGMSGSELYEALGGLWLGLTIYGDLQALVGEGLVREELQIHCAACGVIVCRHFVTPGGHRRRDVRGRAPRLAFGF